MKRQEAYEEFAAHIGYAIPKGVRFSETSMKLPEGLPYEDWVKVMLFLRIIDAARKLREPGPAVDELNRLRAELLAPTP